MSDHRILSSIALALASVGIVVSASRAEAQVAQGELVYVEGTDGRVTLHRRVDSPGEGDGRAQLVPVDASAAHEGQAPQVIGVVPAEAVLTTAGGETQTLEPAPAQLTEAETANGDSFVRPRLGVSFHGGGTLGEPEGWMLGASMRVGVQVGEWFGAYYQPTGIYAALQSELEGERDGALVLWNSFIAEATLFHLLSIGVGPSIDYFGDCDSGLQASAGCAREGSFFGMHGRVALNLGDHGPGQRGALTISFDAHPTWFGDGLETVSFLGGLGVELY